MDFLDSSNSGDVLLPVSPEQIAEQYGPLVSSIAYRMVANPTIAQDMAQEAWLEILKSLPKFEGRSSLSTWIYTIVSRTVLNHLKKERFYSFQEMEKGYNKKQEKFIAPTNIEKELWVKESCDKCLTGFLYCLNSEAKLAFLLRELGDLSHKEIAEILGKKVTAVRQIISRSKKKLRAFMEDRCFLFNPRATCTCQVKEHAIQVDLPATVHKIKKCIGKLRFFKAMDQALPGKNYWQKYL